MLDVTEPRAPGDAQAAHAVVEAAEKSGAAVFQAPASRMSAPEMTDSISAASETVRVSGP